MVTKLELKYIENELNAYLKLKYPDATFVRTCDSREDSAMSVAWLGKSGINNMDQAIGFLMHTIDRSFPTKYDGEILEIQFWDDPQVMKIFPDRKAVYGWVNFLDTPVALQDLQDKSDELRAKSNV